MIRIRIGGHEYRSWDEVPQELKDQLVAAGVDPGPDGEIDTADLWRAGGPVVQRTEVTGPGGRPLPPAVGDALASVLDAFSPPPALREGPLTRVPAPAVAAEGVSTAGQPADIAPADIAPAERGRLPLLVWGVVAVAAVLLVATVSVIVGR